MGIVFRQSIKTTIVIFTGAVLGALINYAYAFILAKQVFGFTRNITNQGAVLQLLVILGTSGTILTYIQRFPPGHKRKVILTMGALAPVVATGLLLLPYLLFRDDIIRLYHTDDRYFIDRFYLWIPVLVLLWSWMSQLDVYLTTQHKVAVSTFVKEVLLRLLNLALVGFLYLELISLDVFIIGTILIYAFPTVILFFLAMRTESFGFSAQWRAFNRAEYKELLQFSWYHMLMGASVMSMGLLDSLMLGVYSRNGLASLPVYTISLFIVTLMTIPYRAMATAAFPTLNEAYIRGETEKLRDLFHRSSLNTLVVAVGMAALIGCNLDNAVRILPEGYEAVTPLVLIMMVGRMVDMMTGLNSEVINISKYYRFNFRISIVLLVLLVIFNRLLIPQYDMYGAAAGTAIALVLFNTGKIFYLWKKMGLQPFSPNSLRIILAGIVAAAAGYLPPFLLGPLVEGANPSPALLVLYSAADAVVRSAVILILYAALLLWLRAAPDLQMYLQSIREKKRLF